MGRLAGVVTYRELIKGPVIADLFERIQHMALRRRTQSTACCRGGRRDRGRREGHGLSKLPHDLVRGEGLFFRGALRGVLPPVPAPLQLALRLLRRLLLLLTVAEAPAVAATPRA
eukprot:COSAG05_NODE_8725_length_677_cov_0.802768_1_plen_115_part_00